MHLVEHSRRPAARDSEAGLRWAANPAQAGLGRFTPHDSRKMWYDFVAILVQNGSEQRTAQVIHDRLVETFPGRVGASLRALDWSIAFAERMATASFPQWLFALLDALRVELTVCPTAAAEPRGKGAGQAFVLSGAA
jgi:hypothetical protein